ncbi:chaperonin 10-like protein [Xylogone sp. PMI_703]|nr:chaperonin 10-like protein [Xylogone sp. PMI_703]
MALENIKYLALRQGGSLVPTSATKPTITEPNEVMIRLKAIAINPADYKMVDYGRRVESWPCVPGLDGSGIVEAIGEEVKNFKVGDEVLAMFTSGDRGASFQSFAVVKEMMVAKKPSAWSFEEAASLAVCYFTAVTALGVGLKTPLPFLNDEPQPAGISLTSVLILGGSSSLGAAVIQLLRISIPDCIILATSSPKHHSHIIDIGANKALDRSSEALIEQVKLASGSRGVDAILDAVGAGSTQRDIFRAFDPDGPKRYAQVWTGDEEIAAPSGVDSVMFRAADAAGMQGGRNIMRALQTLLEEDKYKLPLPVRIVGGFDKLEEGLELMRKGVSGEKLVVSV